MHTARLSFATLFLLSSLTTYLKGQDSDFTDSVYYKQIRSSSNEGKSVKPDTPKIKKTERLQPSAYYDALSLYYLLHGYKTYPQLASLTTRMLDDTTPSPPAKPGDDSDNNDFPTSSAVTPSFVQWSSYKAGGPEHRSRFMPPPPPDSVFYAIAIATGKIVKEFHSLREFTAADSDLVFQAGEEELQQALIDSILARNALLPTSSSRAAIVNAYNGVLALPIINNRFITQPPATLSSKPFSNTVSLLGGGSLTALLTGLADFYIERLKAEVSETFLIHLAKILDKYPELRILFPNTLQSLLTIDIADYHKNLETLKNNFAIDNRSLLGNFARLSQLEKYRRLIGDHPLLTLVFAAADIAGKLRHTTVVPQILEEVYRSDYVVGVRPNNFSAAFKLAGVLSASVRNVSQADVLHVDRGWIEEKRLAQLVRDTAVFRLFLALVTQRCQGIDFVIGANTYSIRQLLITATPQILRSQTFALHVVAAMNTLNGSFAQLFVNHEKPTAERLIDGFARVGDAVLNFAEVLITVLPDNSTTISLHHVFTDIREVYLPWTRQAATVYSFLIDKNYTSAFYSADTLFRAVYTRLKADQDAVLQLQEVKKSGALKRHWQGNRDSTDQWYATLIHYGLFVATVASADTEEEVKNAIQAFALPKGSSRIKKENKWTLTVNGYAGFYHAWNKRYEGASLPHQETSLYAPLGLAISHGHFLNGSLSLYAGVIDIGAIFSYRLKDSASIESDIRFEQVFSPSVSLIYGLPVIRRYNLPFSVGASVQWGPKLRKIDNELGNSSLPLMTLRYQVFAAVDIPIFNLFVARYGSKKQVKSKIDYQYPNHR